MDTRSGKQHFLPLFPMGGGGGSTLKGINICSLGAIVGPGPKTYRENCLLNHIQACDKVFIINYAK